MKAPKLEDKFDIHNIGEFEDKCGDQLCVVLGVVSSGEYGTRVHVLAQGTGSMCSERATELSESTKGKYTHLLVMPMSDLSKFNVTRH